MVGEAATAEVALVGSTPAFACHIDQYVVRDHERINRDLRRAIKTWQSSQDGVSSSNRDGWHSSRTLFARTEPVFVALQRQIKSALLYSLKRCWSDFDPSEQPSTCDGWININQTGAFNTAHDHGLAHLSGIYYVAVPQGAHKTSGLLEIMNPAGAGSPRLPSGRPLVSPKVLFEPVAGQMIVFPSHLIHWVYPNREPDERISVAFNLRVLDHD